MGSLSGAGGPQKARQGLAEYLHSYDIQADGHPRLGEGAEGEAQVGSVQQSDPREGIPKGCDYRATTLNHWRPLSFSSSCQRGALHRTRRSHEKFFLVMIACITN